MIVLGFSGFERGGYYREHHGLRFVGHDAAVALVADGQLLFAAEEERFSREKHTSALPLGALRAALAHAGLELSDVDRVAYTWNVTLRRYLNMCLHHTRRVPVVHGPELAWTGLRVVRDLMRPARVTRAFEAALGEKLPPVFGVAHHVGHAATAYLPSPHEHAAVLTIDGQGEDESASLGEWEGTRYRAFQSVRSPDSIGILYGMLTDFLGMRAGWDEYKVMGMAAHGDPARFRRSFERMVMLRSRGRYRTDRTVMVFKPGYCAHMLQQRFGIPQRRRGDALEQVHFDVAAALQEATERVVFHLLKRLRQRSSSRILCMAGGVAQNSVLNGKILRNRMFDEVWIPPVPGDHGGALGAALFAHQRLTGGQRVDCGFSAFAGPEASDLEIVSELDAHGTQVVWERVDDPVPRAAEVLARGGILAWYQGRMEYGPRALGHRSILADPRERATRDKLNLRIKEREEYRPFAGAVPLELVSRWFELDRPSPYMQFVVPILESRRAQLAAIDHDGTCRAQTVDVGEDPLFHRLLHAFGEHSGVPVLLNTSFNGQDEPIVCTPREALRTFLKLGLDGLVMGRYLISARARQVRGVGL